MTKSQATRIRRWLLCAAALTMTMDATGVSGRRQPAGTPQCQAEGALVRVPDLREGSGVAASRRHTGRLWAHNDSGQPVLVMLTDRGAVAARVRLTGATVEDWEALAAGPCPGGSCLYVGDIGDNNAKRRRITIYRIPEPDGAGASAEVRDVFHATYPDGPQDAETLLVTPKGEIFVVTKGESGPIAIYRFPPDLRAGATSVLQRVGKRGQGKARPDERITDGAVSPNGAWIVLRTNRALHMHPASVLVSGELGAGHRVSLRDLGEPQGEGVAFADDTTLYLIGEGGGRAQAGTFARMTCRF